MTHDGIDAKRNTASYTTRDNSSMDVGFHSFLFVRTMAVTVLATRPNTARHSRAVVKAAAMVGFSPALTSPMICFSELGRAFCVILVRRFQPQSMFGGFTEVFCCS